LFTDASAQQDKLEADESDTWAAPWVTNASNRTFTLWSALAEVSYQARVSVHRESHFKDVRGKC